MGATQLSTRQLGASSVNKDDIDTTTTGKALVTKLVAGTNISFSSTGVDAGTGDVTINASAASFDGGTTANDVEITNSTKGIILTAPDTGRWRVTILNDGTLVTTQISAGTTTTTTTTTSAGNLLHFYNADLTTPYAGATPGTAHVDGVNSAFSSETLTGDGYFEFKLDYPNNTGSLDIRIIHTDTSYFQLGTDRGSDLAVPNWWGNNQSSTGLSVLLGKWIRFNRTGDTISITYSATQGGSQTTFYTFSQSSSAGGSYRFRLSNSTENGVTNASKS